MKSRADFRQGRVFNSAAMVTGALMALSVITAAAQSSVIRDKPKGERNYGSDPVATPTPAPDSAPVAAPKPAPAPVPAPKPAPLAGPVAPKPSSVVKRQGLAVADFLNNGDFEEAMEVKGPKGEKLVSAAGWTSLIGDLPQVVTWGNDPKETPRKGSRFLRVIDKSPDEPVAIESVRLPAQSGVEYGASLWVRSQDKGDPALYLNFYNKEGDRLKYKVGQALTSGPYQDWTNLYAVLKAPRGTVEVSLAIYSYPKDVGTYDFDDAMLGPIGTGGQLPQPRTEEPPAPPSKPENPATIVNWQGKPGAATAGVPVPLEGKPEAAPVHVPTTEEQAQMQAAADARADAVNALQDRILGGGAPITEEERQALGIEPLPAEGGQVPLEAKPLPNSELPPPWIMPKAEAEPGK